MFNLLYLTYIFCTHRVLLNLYFFYTDLWDQKHRSTEIDISLNSSMLDVSAKLGNELKDYKFHTEFELEYNFMRKYTNTIKFDLNLQDLSQDTGSSNKYIGILDLYTNFVTFDKIHILGTFFIMCNNEDLLIETNVDGGNLFNMNVEAKYKHISSSNLQEVKFELSSKSETHPFINVEESVHLKKDNNKYLGEHTIKFIGYEQENRKRNNFNTLIELEYASDSGFVVKAHHISEGRGDKHEKLLEASYSSPSDGHYNAKVKLIYYLR